jgi:hypothetical protein
MKKIILTKTLFTLVVLFFIVLLSSCTENYSTGERVGMITRFSQKGLVYPSWEGSLNTTQTGMNSAEPFEFSVDNDREDPLVIALLDSAATEGWKVKIRYHEVIGKNWFSNRGMTDHFVTDVEVLDRDPVGSVFGNNREKEEVTSESPQCKCQGKIVDTIYVVIDKTK